MTDTTHLDELVRTEAEHADTTRDAPLPEGVKGTQPNKEAARVYTIRLQPDLVDTLERVAKEIDVPTSAVIRGFIQDGLAARQKETAQALIGRITSDSQKLARLLG